MLNLIKKATAIIVVLIVLLKVLILDTFALSAAPVFSEVLVEIFGTLLVASGVSTQEEVNEMSWADVNSNVEKGISSGIINPAEVVVDTAVGKMKFMEWLAERSKDTAAVSDVVGTGVKVWLNSLTSDDIIGTSSVDMNGYTSMIVLDTYEENGDIRYYFSNSPGVVKSDGRYMFKTWDYYICYEEGVLTFEKEYSATNYHFTVSPDTPYIIYGDWTMEDGTTVDTGEETTAEVGETADGESVTLDDIQSGAVSAEDTTLDYDKFNDEAIIDLLQQILGELEKVPVVEDVADNTLAEDFAQELDGSVALEMEDLQALQLPTGIATVFPFCLPFDFAYGLELLAAKPVAPKFEIPFEIPSFGLYPGTSDVITLDLAEYSKYFEVGRWVQVVIFAIGLCFISFKVVKGVH